MGTRSTGPHLQPQGRQDRRRPARRQSGRRQRRRRDPDPRRQRSDPRCRRDRVHGRARDHRERARRPAQAGRSAALRREESNRQDAKDASEEGRRLSFFTGVLGVLAVQSFLFYSYPLLSTILRASATSAYGSIGLTRKPSAPIDDSSRQSGAPPDAVHTTIGKLWRSRSAAVSSTPFMPGMSRSITASEAGSRSIARSAASPSGTV